MERDAVPGRARVDAASPTPWFPAPRPDAAVRLVCLPHAGGGTLAYRAWTRHLPPWIEVCPARLPGRESRLAEPPIDRMGPLVEALAAALARLPRRRTAIYGHSMGARVAFALAQRLDDVAHVFAAASPAPGRPHGDAPLGEADDDTIVDALRRHGGTPPAVLAHRGLLDLLLPAVRADFALLETWVADPTPLACAVTAFAGLDDPAAPPAHAAEWERFTSARFRLHAVAAGHFFHVEHPDVVCDHVARVLGG